MPITPPPCEPPRKDYVADFYKSQRKGASRWQGLVFPDIWLILVSLSLIAIGMVMVTSASVNQAIKLDKGIYFYTYRQAFFYVIGLIFAYIFFCIPTIVLARNSGRFLMISLALLVLIYIPGVGLSINGARRWINLPLFHLQVGEMLKLVMVLYAAAFLQRNHRKLADSWQPMLELLVISSLFALLLLLQPDYGTTMVIMATILGMMFMGGVNIYRFGFLCAVVFVIMAVILVLANYRLERLFVFLDPWVEKYKYSKGYQLINSLIAVGNGSLFGTGLGQSIQKHEYLPEAHTDFIFAIICEEFGFIGALVVMGLFALLVWRAFVIGRIAGKVRRYFSALTAYGIGLLLAIQTLVNIGVTTGSLPTKGLTLPLISYGGSSVVTVCIALGILARIDSESRFQAQRELVL